MMCWAGVIVSSYILCITVLTPRGINSALLSNPVLVRAGDISFSIYSVHPFVDSWMRAHVIPESLKGLDCLIAILVGIWVTAEITYRCVEMPCMRLGNALCGKVDDVARRIESRFEKGYHQVGMGEEDIDIDDLEVNKEWLCHSTEWERVGDRQFNRMESVRAGQFDGIFDRIERVGARAYTLNSV
jgi:hypothetical protein